MQDSFPWNRLPKEIQVKVLEHLHRRDLSRCRSLSREMFDIIKSSERSMRRRHLELVRIERIGQGRIQLLMRCDEEGRNMKWIACQKRRHYPVEQSFNIEVIRYQLSLMLDYTFKLQLHTLAHLYQDASDTSHQIAAIFGAKYEYQLSSELPPAITDRLTKITKGSEIDRLRINEMELSDATLSSISSSLRRSSCRVRLLSFELSSLASVTPSSLFRFVTDVAPADIVIRMMRGCRIEHFGSAMCRFIVSRRFFSVSELIDNESNDVNIQIDDSLLRELKATTFQISTPNHITAQGLQQFIKTLSDGTRQLVAARIQTTFSIDESFIPSVLNKNVFIRDEHTLDVFSCSSEFN
ncbi:F-box domain protein [Dictyocaulus viviparus]|uniref:F-box domain protein n=1 Tax=Dictyocaulus viviparus TaxID=29172 RepID=A0A0D8XWY4_DICVI|nr:F-box domain protein [Dictyocaulus viviparus]